MASKPVPPCSKSLLSKQNHPTNQEVQGYALHLLFAIERDGIACEPVHEMAAIAFTFLGCLNLGDVLVQSEPTYGGNDYLIKRILVILDQAHPSY